MSVGKKRALEEESNPPEGEPPKKKQRHEVIEGASIDEECDEQKVNFVFILKPWGGKTPRRPRIEQRQKAVIGDDNNCFFPKWNSKSKPEYLHSDYRYMKTYEGIIYEGDNETYCVLHMNALTKTTKSVIKL